MYFIVSKTGGPCVRPPGITGKCKSSPSIRLDENLDKILTCAKDKKLAHEGNHIMYLLTKVENIDVLHLGEVLAEYCKPKPEACHCKTMLDKLLALNPNIDRIEGRFLPDHFMKGCRCYLGSAARAGFKFVELGGMKEQCKGKIEFDEHNYVETCEEYEKKKCQGENGKITKI